MRLRSLGVLGVLLVACPPTDVPRDARDVGLDAGASDAGLGDAGDVAAGGFGTRGALSSDGGWATSTVAGDLDGDGSADLAWTSAGGALELAFGLDRCLR